MTTTASNEQQPSTTSDENLKSSIQAHYTTEFSTLSGFGLRQLQKFGFKVGEGLGKNQTGSSTYVDVIKKSDTKGLGTQEIEDNLHAKIQDSYELLLQKAKPVKSASNDDDSTSSDEEEVSKKKKSKKSKKEKSKKSSKSKDDKESKKNKKKSSKGDKETKKRKQREHSDSDDESTEKKSKAVERSFLITTAVGKEKRVQQSNMSAAMMEHMEKLKQLRDQDAEKVRNRSFLTEEQKEALASKKRRIK